MLLTAPRPTPVTAGLDLRTVPTLFPLDEQAPASRADADPIEISAAAVLFGFGDKLTGGHMAR